MTSRRWSHQAGDSWSKWGDPAYIADLDWRRRERRNFAVRVWVWSVALGSWAGIVVALISGRMPS